MTNMSFGIRIRNFIVWIFPVLACFIHPAYGYEHPGGMHPRAQIEFVKQQIRMEREPWLSAFNQLKTQADSALKARHHALEDFHIPGFYVDKEAHRKNSEALNTDGFNAYSCALAWQLTGEKKYGDKAISLLNAWASVNKRYSEADGPLVMTYMGASLVITAELMRNYSAWKKKDREQFKYWLESVYRKAAYSISPRKNNWGDWGQYGAMLADYYLDNPLALNQHIKQMKKDLPAKIADEGYMIEEVKREANGIWYTYFSLTPVTGAFWIAYNATGENLFFSGEGKSVKKALDYLLYYNQHPQEWPWYSSPRQGKPDDAKSFWPANLMEAMYGVYKDESYVKYVWGYRPLMFAARHYVWTYPTLMSLRTGDYK